VEYMRAKKHQDPEAARRLVDAYGLAGADSDFERKLEACWKILRRRGNTSWCDKYRYEHEISARHHDQESGDTSS
jgi:hypothetical protein